MDTGMIVIVVIIVLFYVRLYLVNRGKRRREKQAIIERMKLGKKAPPLPASDPDASAFQVKSWWIIVPAILLMLLGLAIFTQSLLPEFKTYWWVPVAIGGVLFIFGFE
jgi:sterol desaturase/sphingolipid hydroxylase (fatty acid hydroxylase superfamily)